MSIISIRSNRPRLHPLGSRKRHYEPPVQSVCAVAALATATGASSPVDSLTNLETPPRNHATGFRKGIKLLIPVFIFAAIYLYGMFEQVSSTSSLTTFENNVFVFLAPAILFAVGGINTYGLWKSRRSAAQRARHPR